MPSEAFFQKRLERLQKRHGDTYSGLAWETRTLDDAPLPEICALISAAWERAYGRRIRIAYTPSLLRLARAFSGAPGLVTLARRDGRVHAVALGLPVAADLPPDTGEVTITTGFCTSAEYENSGLVDALLLHHGLNCLHAGHAFSLYWRAGGAPEADRNAPTALRAATVPLYAKALDCAKAARLGGLSFLQGLGLRWMTWRHRSGGALPAGLAVAPLEEKDIGESAAFLERHQPGTGLRRRYAPEQLAAHVNWNEDGIRGACWTVRRNGRLAGVVYGYANPVGGGDAYFAVDGAAFAPELDAATVKAALSAVEGAARDQLGCFAVMAPASACRAPLDRMGYLPVRTYRVGAMDFGSPVPVTPAAVAGLLLELR